MDINVLFTTRDEWFSTTIRKLTEEPVSHVAIEFPDLGFVMHSNIKGVHIQWAKTFHRDNRVVYEVPLTIKDGYQRLDTLMMNHEFSFYDVGAIMWLGTKLALRRHCKLPLAKDNLWQSTGMFLCTEIATEYLYGYGDPSITPYKLYRQLLDKQIFENN